MKTTGRNGSLSEYTIFSEHIFIHQGVLYDHVIYRDRYYKLEEPDGIHSRIGREGGLARRRISKALFSSLLNECKERISKAEKGGAA